MADDVTGPDELLDCEKHEQCPHCGSFLCCGDARAEYADLRRQRDELRRMLQRALDSLVCAVDAGGGDPVSHILCCEIRKALANCK